MHIMKFNTRVSSVELSVVLSVEKMSVGKNMTLNSTIFNTTVLGRLGDFFKVIINSKAFYNYLFSTAWCCLLLLSVVFSVEKNMTLNTTLNSTNLDTLLPSLLI